MLGLRREAACANHRHRCASTGSQAIAPSAEDMDLDDSCSVALGPVAPSSDNDGEQEPYCVRLVVLEPSPDDGDEATSPPLHRSIAVALSPEEDASRSRFVAP